MTFLLACLAGGLGAAVRFGASVALLELGMTAPWSVLIVNLAGSPIAGAAIGSASSAGIAAGTAFIVAAGLAGGLTTFSTWSVETVQLLRARALVTKAITFALNLGGGLGAAAIGFQLTCGC